MGSSQKRSRTYSRRLVLCSVVYVPALLSAQRLSDIGGPLPVALLAVAFVAGLGMIVFAIQSVRHGDELQHRIHLEALAVGFLALALVTFTAMFAPAWFTRELRWRDLWLLLSAFWLVGLAQAHLRRR
jgi:hypothetical protein